MKQLVVEKNNPTPILWDKETTIKKDWGIVFLGVLAIRAVKRL